MAACLFLSSTSHSLSFRAWLKSDVFSVQVQAVLEVANAENAKEVEQAIREKYSDHNVVMGPYGLI